MNSQPQPGSRQTAQECCSKHKGRAKEILRGAKGGQKQQPSG